MAGGGAGRVRRLGRGEDAARARGGSGPVGAEEKAGLEPSRAGGCGRRSGPLGDTWQLLVGWRWRADASGSVRTCPMVAETDFFTVWTGEIRI